MKLFLFDIDGTLLISRGIGREAKRRAMLECFGEVGDLDNHVFGGKTDWQILADLLAPFGKTSADIGREIAGYERVMARHMREIKNDYRADALPHAMALVKQLRDRADTMVGLVTGNTSMTARIKLEMAGFKRDCFAVGAFGNEAAERDKLTRLALERAEAQSARSFDGGDVFVIGDTLADIDAARAIDAVAVAVCTGYTAREQLRDREPDFLLDDLSSFPCFDHGVECG
ncbi:MAG: haloacid dehalogenase-like hydrolase [Chloroflexota bacterium]|nr:haloacid dehalogenase-like hydrolase [Chloroflexota bacterium]